MESTRQQRVARLIQKDLAEIVRLRAKHHGPGVMISVTVVRVTPDLGLAKVYLSIFPSNKGKDVIEKIKKQSKTLRFDLGKKVGKQLRIVPELQFYIDDSLDYADRIDELLQ